MPENPYEAPKEGPQEQSNVRRSMRSIRGPILMLLALPAGIAAAYAMFPAMLWVLEQYEGPPKGGQGLAFMVVAAVPALICGIFVFIACLGASMWFYRKDW